MPKYPKYEHFQKLIWSEPHMWQNEGARQSQNKPKHSITINDEPEVQFEKNLFHFNNTNVINGQYTSCQ